MKLSCAARMKLRSIKYFFEYIQNIYINNNYKVIPKYCNAFITVSYNS